MVKYSWEESWPVQVKEGGKGMKKQWMTWGMLVVLMVSSLMLMGVKCNPNQTDSADQQEQVEELTAAEMSKEALEQAGVPVYSSIEGIPVSHSVMVDGNGRYSGIIILRSTTCPPVNVMSFYDAVLIEKYGATKTSGPGPDPSATYTYTTNKGEKVTIKVENAGSAPEEGTLIGISFET
jgi:hypothetical protein